jgi:steroid delta-isomerase-like uncharacterized protein
MLRDGTRDAAYRGGKEVNDMLELLNRQFKAYEASDWGAYHGTLAPESVYEELATRRRITGADEIVALVQRWKAAFPDSKATILRTFELGDTAIAEVEWTGTHKGALESPFGTLQATNKPVRVRAVLIVRSKDGKIVEGTHYFDLMTLLSGIGVGPAIGAGTEKGAQPVTAGQPVRA